MPMALAKRLAGCSQTTDEECLTATVTWADELGISRIKTVGSSTNVTNAGNQIAIT
jgi:hypothetical protein